jgi:hypothetical protein
MIRMIKRTPQAIEVTVRSDGFTPQAFRWDESQIRVMGVESVETVGAERRYRVRTRLGRFEITLYTDAGRWFVRRSPTRIGRALWRWQSAPRYALPARRRRTRGRALSSVKAIGPDATGGGHADGFALV